MIAWLETNQLRPRWFVENSICCFPFLFFLPPCELEVSSANSCVGCASVTRPHDPLVPQVGVGPGTVGVGPLMIVGPAAVWPMHGALKPEAYPRFVTCANEIVGCCSAGGSLLNSTPTTNRAWIY